MRALPKVVVAGFVVVSGWVAAADDQAICLSDIQPSKRLLEKIDNQTAALSGTAEEKSSFKSRLILTASQRWTCSTLNQATCCENIPLAVIPNSISTNKCYGAVSFPYGELTIIRNGGGFKPVVSWVLSPTATPPPYEFGSVGIEIVKIFGSTQPVDTSGSDKCKYKGTHDQFKCKANGKKFAKADHLANVYVAGHLDEADYRCLNIDPLIANAGN